MTTRPVYSTPRPAREDRGESVNFLPHIHNYRGLSIVLIVAVHCISVFDWQQQPELERWLKIALLNSTIFFLFIAGYLFQHLSGRFDYRSYLRSKLRNVILPYVLISIPAIVLFTLVMQRPEVREGFYDQPVWRQVVEFYLTGQQLAPFWFLPTIAMFYVTAPLWIFLDRLKGFYLCLPVLLLLPVFVSRGEHQPLQSFVHFAPVYLLGMAFSRHRALIDRWLPRCWWALPPLAALLVFGEWHYAHGTHSWYNTLQKIALCPVMYEILRRVGARADPLFARLGTLSFGIFFLHSYVISAAKLAIDRLWGAVPGSVLGVLCAATVATLLTMALLIVAKRVLGRSSRMIVGC